MSPNVTVFAIVLALALILFVWSCYRLLRLVKLGRPDDRFDRKATRLRNMFVYAFGQRRVVRKPFGVNHFVLFWCFIILLPANLEFLLHGLFSKSIALSKLPDGVHYGLATLFDMVSLLAFLAVLIALGRRLFFPPKFMEARSRDAFVILSLVGLLMLAFFGLHAAEIADGTEDAQDYMMVSHAAADVFFDGMSSSDLEFWAEGFWWMHAVILLGFLNYLPHSKHLHVLTAIPNCFFRDIEKTRLQPIDEFGVDDAFGASQVDQLRWKTLFDACSCTECGRCSEVCPARAAGKTLNPRLVIHAIKVNLFRNGSALRAGGKPDPDLVGQGDEASIAEESLWSCTTCAACMDVCPVFIEHVPAIIDMRRSLVLEQGRMPENGQKALRSIMDRAHPWPGTGLTREDWADGLQIQRPPFGNHLEVLYWVGCASALDEQSKRIAVAIARVLKAAGISFGILGAEELCCGDPARRIGDEYLFQTLARRNIETLHGYGVKTIVCSCPHCFNTLKNEYPRFGGTFEVRHHSEFIHDLIRQGKVTPVGELGRNVTYHDACYLGRYNDIYQSPRDILQSIPGTRMIEMERNRQDGFCCGGGGGAMWTEGKDGERINHIRTREAIESGAQLVATACPYCLQMFEDGAASVEDGMRLESRDLAEIVAQSLA